MDDLTQYMARVPIRKGKMVPWQAEIIALRSAGYPYRSICGYLAEQGVKASPAEVLRFLRRCGRPELAPARPCLDPAASRQQPPERERGQLPKFEWTPGKPKSSW